MHRFWLVLFFTASIATAQSRPPRDSWLMQNYHIVPGPKPGEIQPAAPALSQLQEIQNTMLNILRKANFAGDYEAALAAAAQAAAAAHLIGTITGEFKPGAPAQPPRPAAEPQPQRPPANPRPAGAAVARNPAK